MTDSGRITTVLENERLQRMTSALALAKEKYEEGLRQEAESRTSGSESSQQPASEDKSASAEEEVGN